MTINASTGLIEWTPDNSDVGTHSVTVRVEDTLLAFDTQAFTVTVANVNDAPTITSTPITVATEGSPYSYDVDADDPDVGDTLTFSLDTAPSGMAIDPETGVIQWTPARDAGDHPVTVTVTDDGPPSLTDTQSYTLTVNAIPSELVYTSTGDPINIGDNKTVSSSINVSGTGLTVGTLTIQINLTHANPSDLTAKLVSPTGIELEHPWPDCVGRLHS